MKFVYQTITDPLQDSQANFEQLEGSGIFRDTQLGGDLQGSLPTPTLAPGAAVETSTSRRTVLLWGGVTSTGTILHVGSGDWTPSRTSAGTYVITTSTTFSVFALPVAALDFSNIGQIASYPLSSTTFGVSTYNSAGALTDLSWNFIAVAF